MTRQECRAWAHRFCSGRGLDIGADMETVFRNARPCPVEDLDLYADASMDFVFALEAPGPFLAQCWRVLKPNGFLLVAETFEIADGPWTYIVVTDAPGTVVQKQGGPEPLRWVGPDFRQRAAVCRYGGFGDNVMALKVLRELKRLNYHVTFYTSDRGAQIVAHDPCVDEVVIHTEDQVPPSELRDYWGRLGKHYDRFVNLNGTMEGALLFRGPGYPNGGHPDIPLDDCYGLSHEDRHARGNTNYMEHMLKAAGMEHLDATPPAINFSRQEMELATFVRGRYQGEFLVLMTLGGSADHKLWAHAEAFAKDLLDRCPEARIITVGEDKLRLMEWDHPRVVKQCGYLNFRGSALLAWIADLVISTETGMAHVAAGLGSPALVLLSHSSEENLTKHWPSAVSLRPPVDCHPCHRLHFTNEGCPTDPMEFRFTNGETRNAPVCAARMTPSILMPAAMRFYENWLGTRKGAAA